MPPPQTAVGIISQAIARLESSPMSADLGGATGLMMDYLGPEMPFGQRLALSNRWLFAPLIQRLFEAAPSLNATIRTTIAATMIGGGVRRNVLPTKAWAVVNFRVMPGQTSADVLEHVQTTIDDERIQLDTSGTWSEPSSISDPNSASFRTLHRTIQEVFPETVVTPSLAVVTTDSRHYESLSDQLFRFIPTRMTNEDMARPHGINERIGVENYLEIIQFFIRQIRNSAS